MTKNIVNRRLKWKETSSMKSFNLELHLNYLYFFSNQNALLLYMQKNKKYYVQNLLKYHKRQLTTNELAKRFSHKLGYILTRVITSLPTSFAVFGEIIVFLVSLFPKILGWKEVYIVKVWNLPLRVRSKSF